MGTQAKVYRLLPCTVCGVGFYAIDDRPGRLFCCGVALPCVELEYLGTWPAPREVSIELEPEPIIVEDRT